MIKTLWTEFNVLKDVTLLEKFSKQFRVTFPTKYLELAKAGIEEPFEKQLVMTKKGNERVIDNFVSFNEDTYSIFDVTDWIHDDVGFANLIPFASDPFGNYFCFDKSTNPMKIVWWFHETDDIEEISDDFDQFIASLYNLPHNS